jgi:bacteriocin-like protein
MTDNKIATRLELDQTDRRGLSGDETQELSKKEMENVEGGLGTTWGARYLNGGAFDQTSIL